NLWHLSSRLYLCGCKRPAGASNAAIGNNGSLPGRRQCRLSRLDDGSDMAACKSYFSRYDEPAFVGFESDSAGEISLQFNLAYSWSSPNGTSDARVAASIRLS